MKKILFILSSLASLLIIGTNCRSQQIGISGTGALPDPSSILDISVAGTSPKGLLIPRLTTAERDSISSPANSLLIFNTTSRCFEAWDSPSATWVAFGCIGCTAPTTVTATASPNPICEGGTLTLTGSAINATGWSWTGPNGFTSSLQSPTITGITTAGAGIYTLSASNTCASASPVNTTSVSVSSAPTTANAGSAINLACGQTTATLAGNNPSIGTGVWSLVSGAATISTPGSPSSAVTGLAPSGTATLRWTISNSPCTPSTSDVIITTSSCFTCGSPFTDSRDSKSYNTVLIGTQCWMAENLNYGTYVTAGTGQGGAGTQKYCYGDNTGNCNFYGGLYEWNEMMNGSSSCDGTGSSQPACSIPVQGICPSGWHIPSHYEWTLLEKNSGSNPGAFPYDETTTGWLGTDEGSNLKQTGTNYWQTANATNSTGFTGRGSGFSFSGFFYNIGYDGICWTSTENGATNAWYHHLTHSDLRLNRNHWSKEWGTSVRCVKD